MLAASLPQVLERQVLAARTLSLPLSAYLESELALLRGSASVLAPAPVPASALVPGLGLVPVSESALVPVQAQLPASASASALAL